MKITMTTKELVSVAARCEELKMSRQYAGGCKWCVMAAACARRTLEESIQVNYLGEVVIETPKSEEKECEDAKERGENFEQTTEAEK